MPTLQRKRFPVLTAGIPKLPRLAPPRLPSLRTRSTRVLREKSPQQGGPPPQSCPPTALTRRERGLRKRTSGSCRGRKLKQPSAPIRHPQGKRRPAAMRRRSEMINQQSPSAREWPLRHPNQARLPLHRQQRLRLRSSGCTSLASLCLLDERSGNVCLSGAADRRVRSHSPKSVSGHTRLDYRRLRPRLPVVSTSGSVPATLVLVFGISALHASLMSGRRLANSLRVAGGRALPERETGTKSESACCEPACPLKTLGPSGNITTSPRRKVLSVRSSGTGFVTSPGALGLITGLF